MEYILVLAVVLLIYQVNRTKAFLKGEEEVPRVPLLGRRELWGKNRAVIVWGIAGVPLHASSFAHTTLWMP